jgi:large subunit ribosomal protein L35
MVKQKTRKSAAKRFTVSKGGKVLRRHTMQDHFNVGRPKKTIRGRRRDVKISTSDRRRLARLLPFSALPTER